MHIWMTSTIAASADFCRPAMTTTRQRGFSLDHTELVMSASVDPYFRGYFNIALLDEEVEIEEAWFQTTGLGNGLSLKGGRFLSGIGYQNEQHPHAWDFADNNLMYRRAVRRGLRQRRRAAEMGGADRHCSWNSAPKPGAAPTSPAPTATRTASAATRLFGHLGGDVGDVAQLARAACRICTPSASDRDGELEDLNDVEAETAVLRHQHSLAGGLRLEMGAQWQRHASRTSSSPPNISTATKTGSLLCEDNMAAGGTCSGTEDAYRATPVRLLRPGRLPVHAALAHRLPLRPARFGHRSIAAPTAPSCRVTDYNPTRHR